MAGLKILVIGGGFGGAAAARAARSVLDRQHSVTLIDRSRRSYLCGSFPLLIVGERETFKVSRSLGSLANRGIRYVEAAIDAIDVNSRTVASSSGTFEYNYLVLAPGVVYDWHAVPGSSAAYSFYDLEAAQRLRRKLARFRKGRVLIAIASTPYKCPPAPFEAAMVLDWAFKRRGVRKDIEIHIFTPEPAALAVAGTEAVARLVKDMGRKVIELHTSAGVTEVARNGREAAFSDGTSMDAELVITVPTHRVPRIITEAGLAGETGWVKASPESLETQHSGVYAVGDVNSVPMANGRPLPKSGVLASSEGETAGLNIAAAINGTEPARFPGVGHCFIAYSGTQTAMVGGEFLAEGKPDVKLQPATARGHRAKERFERDWRRFKI